MHGIEPTELVQKISLCLSEPFWGENTNYICLRGIRDLKVLNLSQKQPKESLVRPIPSCVFMIHFGVYNSKQSFLDCFYLI